MWKSKLPSHTNSFNQINLLGSPGRHFYLLISPAFRISPDTGCSADILLLRKDAAKFKNKYLKSLELQKDEKGDVTSKKNLTRASYSEAAEM